MGSKKPWRKILYENQDYPDNHTDKEIFLQGLRKNVNFKEVSLLEAIYGANLLVQEISTVVAFILIYCYIINQVIDPTVIFNLSAVVTALGYLVYILSFKKEICNELGHGLRTVLAFVIFGLLFSPVLHTLTDTISTDTIYTMTFFMVVIHLIFFDYGVPAAVVSNSLSLSAIIFASICLASRLSSAHHVYFFMTIATEMFVLFPLIRKKIGNSALLTFCLIVNDIYFMYQISILSTLLFVITVFSILIMCPILFVKYQRHKENIYGPWDEAIVDDIETISNIQ